MTFKSKKGILHAILYWGSTLILVGVAYYGGGGWLWVLPAVIGLMFAWIWFFTFYKLTDNELVIFYGPMVERIPYHEINRVSPCRNFKSSAALSINRLEIHHTGGLMRNSYISPVNRDKFMRELRIFAPKAKYRFLSPTPADEKAPKKAAPPAPAAPKAHKKKKR